MDKVIFLDIDGVLNTKWWYTQIDRNTPKDKYGYTFDPRSVANLKKIIDETGADIVISSSWKSFGLTELEEMWQDRGLPGFVIDVTPTPAIRNNRGDEIDAWLEECRTECQYVIIDDLDAYNFNEHQIPRLLVVNPFNGLDEDTAKRAIDLLNSD